MQTIVQMVKQSSTVSKLALIAKKHGIPLLGDWRYAAKMLGKFDNASTIAGKQRFRKALGFLTSPERRLLKAHAQKQKALGIRYFDIPEYAIDRGLTQAKHKGKQKYLTLHGAGDKTSSPVLIGKADRKIHTHPPVSQLSGDSLLNNKSRWPEHVMPSATGAGRDAATSEYTNRNLIESINKIKRPRPIPDDWYSPTGDLSVLTDSVPLHGRTALISSQSGALQGVYKLRWRPKLMQKGITEEPVIHRAYFRGEVPYSP